MAFNLFKKNKPETPATPNPGGSHYAQLTVSEVVTETRDAISIVFKQPNPPISYKAGQFLTLVLPIDGKEVRRAYSLNSSPDVDSSLSVTVKRVDNGLVSNWLNDHVKAGDSIRVMQPMGHFTTEFQPASKRHLVMFAGGSGITPMMSIIKSLMKLEQESICTLIYCNRNIDSIIFYKALTEMEVASQGRLQVIHVLDNAPMNWQGYSGLLNQEMLARLFERMPSWPEEVTTYLMCGPEGMMKNVESLLSTRKIPAAKVFKESFVQGTIDKPQKTEPETTSGSRTVVIHYDGLQHKVEVASGATILQSALDQGIDLPYSCQSGLCTACRGKALSGKVKLDEEEGLSAREIAEGYVLTCVGHPVTDDVVIEIG